MFQTTRRRLALWYTTVTAILLLIFASGVYFYVRNTLVERVDDTLNHVVEVVQRSLVIEAAAPSTGRVLTATGVQGEAPLRVNVDDSFRDNAQTLEDDHIDIEWFGPDGQLQWSTLSVPIGLPLQLNTAGKTVHLKSNDQDNDQVLRQISRRVQIDHQILGYLRVSHPWFEVSKPSRQLMIDLSIWSGLIIVATGTIGWLLSGLAMAPVRQSYQQLKQFTADASHELRNPIAVIQTNVQVALADPEPDADFQHSQLQVVERLTRRLGRLVDNLLFLARQDGGLIPMQWEDLDLHQLLAEVLEEQGLIAQGQGLELVYQGAGEAGAGTQGEKELPHLTGDRDQLVRLFTNLISNAIQYTPEGTVTVSLDHTQWQGRGAYQVTVEDTGIGISKVLQSQVFDRFYRVDKARSRRDGAGSGLGLAIAKAIITNHQGHIRLDSQVDQGTTVTVTLPVHPGA
ncbi:sensor histidine kinase [Leptothoe sp. PORK10 BA2]|uniref:sensor histidine kinase n=1 Tax=Leptothoe sp. PORK10 BA2 TaxID=3110254 RepID=UPI002B20628A|nr:HAMP domain-containing sensor histidine kinase [Leptothoe sp. PORK10 BA2]MEA5465521.1 HAMP domain-containing sensor histidine kinase [Leptothoe sp. PORK10 BA2]